MISSLCWLVENIFICASNLYIVEMSTYYFYLREYFEGSVDQWFFKFGSYGFCYVSVMCSCDHFIRHIWYRFVLLVVLSPVCLYFQFECDLCLVRFQSLRDMRSHRRHCVFCDTCGLYVERRHLLTCEGNRPKGKRVLCNVCHRLRTRRNMARHMLTEHFTTNFKIYEHPECISEVRSLYLIVT